MHDPVILDYEIRLTSEIDSIISNISLLNPDLSNKATIDWMAQLARQKISYEVETAEEPNYPVHDIDEPVADEDADKVVEEDVDIELMNFEYDNRDWKNKEKCCRVYCSILTTKAQ